MLETGRNDVIEQFGTRVRDGLEEVGHDVQVVLQFGLLARGIGRPGDVQLQVAHTIDTRVHVDAQLLHIRLVG